MAFSGGRNREWHGHCNSSPAMGLNAAVRAGEWVGDFRVERPLKSGGMASVFRAVCGITGAHVALKTARVSRDEQACHAKRLSLEASVLSHIHHPNVVEVRASGRSGDTHYIALEHVDGCTLAELNAALEAQGRALAPAVAVHIAARVADALHAAHNATDSTGRPLGIVHRDVSPENIVLGRDGSVKLIDFGIAHSHLAEARPHRTVEGKLNYMAPEQARGERVDERADVYALGVVLWEMLTCRAFMNDASVRAQTLAALHPFAQAPSVFSPWVPLSLDRAVLEALTADRTHRTASAAAMQRALAAALPLADAIDSDDLGEVVSSTLATPCPTAANDSALFTDHPCAAEVPSGPTRLLHVPLIEQSEDRDPLDDVLVAVAVFATDEGSPRPSATTTPRPAFVDEIDTVIDTPHDDSLSGLLRLIDDNSEDAMLVESEEVLLIAAPETIAHRVDNPSRAIIFCKP